MKSRSFFTPSLAILKNIMSHVASAAHHSKTSTVSGMQFLQK